MGAQIDATPRSVPLASIVSIGSMDASLLVAVAAEVSVWKVSNERAAWSVGGGGCEGWLVSVCKLIVSFRWDEEK